MKLTVYEGDDWYPQRSLFTSTLSPNGKSTAANVINATTAAVAAQIYLAGVTITAAEATSSKFHVLIFGSLFFLT